MCRDCGCSGGDAHHHAHSHHDHAPSPHTVNVHTPLLKRNDERAERNRQSFRERGLIVLNVLSAPGSGKTAFIERTLTDLKGRLRAGVVVGDLATDNDAQRLRRSGAPVVQITTGSVCHLEADMVARAVGQLDLDALHLLVIENVGNLVCPASFDLGEAVRIVLLSVTEGEDKPLKYPVAFKTAHAVVVNKVDLAEAAGFDRDAALTNVRRIAPRASIFEVSARSGYGMAAWYAYLEQLPGAQSLEAVGHAH
jgi:hydrogenase nickel incorporation protein HypB